MSFSLSLIRLESGFARVFKNLSFRRPLAKFAVGGALTAMFLKNTTSANCAASDDEPSNDSKKGSASQATNGSGGSGGSDADPVGQFIETYGPTLQKLGFGGIMGICTGVTFKRVGNEMAYVVGLGFVAIQALSYLGYIHIDYQKVADDAKKAADLDGDGKLTPKDLLCLWTEVKKVLTFQLPSAGGFSAGVMLGLYFGK